MMTQNYDGDDDDDDDESTATTTTTNFGSVALGRRGAVKSRSCHL